MRRTMLSALGVAVVATSLATGPLSASAVPGDPAIPTTPSCSIVLIAGDPATAPPAPTCYDPSGADLDEFLVPRYVDATGHSVGYEDGNWNPYNWDGPNSTKGASHVTIQSTRYDPGVGSYINDHDWTLTFNTSVTATDAGETYRTAVLPGTCNPHTSQWQVEMFVFNLPDATQRYIPSVGGYFYRQPDDLTTLLPGGLDEHVTAERVLDGHEASMGVLAMYPGTYKVRALVKDAERAVRLPAPLEVPTCGNVLGPDFVNESDAKPRARIALVKRGAVFSNVKVVLGSRAAAAATRYKVIRDPRSGPTLRKTVATAHKTVRYRVRNGTLIKVRAKTLLAKRRIG